MERRLSKKDLMELYGVDRVTIEDWRRNRGLKMIEVSNAYAVHFAGESSVKNYKVNFIRNLNFKYGEFLFDFKTKKFRNLKMIRQIIKNIIYLFLNLLFINKEKLLNNLSNILGIFKFILFYLKK